MRFLIPEGGLHLADVRLAQQQHAHAALAHAAAHSIGQLALEQLLVEGQCSALLLAGFLQLMAQGFGRYADAHAAQLEGTVEHFVVEHDIAVELPVVIVRGSAVVGLAVL